MSDPSVPEAGQEPTGEPPPGFADADPAELDALAEAGWGEGDDEDPHVPPDLLELGEAIKAREAGLL